MFGHEIICRFGVNALSSKACNAFRLTALGRLIEGPGRPYKQRFAIPATAQGQRSRPLSASPGTGPLRVVRGASLQAVLLAAFTFPVDRIDRLGDALHSVAFLLLAPLRAGFSAALSIHRMSRDRKSVV